MARSSTASRPEAPPLTQIGRYELIGEIGQGGMGQVFRARDPLIERDMAIKTIPMHLDTEARREFEARFLREAQSAGRLSHPNIVTIYDVGETDDLVYIAMEYLPGKSLREILDASRGLPLDLMLETAVQMADSLAYAHEHGVVHRDVKPSNVIVTADRGTVKLTDFSIAYLAAASDRTRAGMMLGSPRYMSPEQVKGEAVDGRSDIFSLGAVCHEMLTGRPVFDAEALPALLFRIVNSPVPAPGELRAGVPLELDRIILKCLAKNPQERYAKASDLAADLRKLQQQAPSIPARPRWGRHALAVVLLLLAGWGFYRMGWESHRADRTAGLARDPAPAAAPVPPPVASALSPASTLLPPSAALSFPAPHKSSISVLSLPADSPYVRGIDKKIAELEIMRSELLTKYTPLYPDVITAEKQLKKLRADRARYLREHGAAADPSGAQKN